MWSHDVVCFVLYIPQTDLYIIELVLQHQHPMESCCHIVSSRTGHVVHTLKTHTPAYAAGCGAVLMHGAHRQGLHVKNPDNFCITDAGAGPMLKLLTCADADVADACAPRSTHCCTTLCPLSRPWGLSCSPPTSGLRWVPWEPQAQPFVLRGTCMLAGYYLAYKCTCMGAFQCVPEPHSMVLC